MLFRSAELAYRLPSALAGTFMVLVTCAVGSRMFGPRAGLWAGLALAVAPLVLIESKLATPDATISAFITLAMWALYELWTGRQSRQLPLWAALFWTATAAATLTKGPMAVAVPAATALAVALVGRDWRWLGKLRWRWGVPLYLALTLPWAVAVHVATGGAVWGEMVGYQFVHRVVAPIESHGAPPGFYLGTLVATFFPWSALVPATLVWAWRNRRP